MTEVFVSWEIEFFPRAFAKDFSYKEFYRIIPHLYL